MGWVPHARHTRASLLFAGGRDVKQVQKWLGHPDRAHAAPTSASWTMVWGVLASLITLSAHKPPVKVGDPLAFYEVAATIIPVLFIGIAFQAKAMEPEDWPKGSLAIAATLVSFATISSEAAAVRVLALQHTTQDARTLINVSMGFLTFSLLVTPVGEQIFEPLLELIPGISESLVEIGAFLMLVLITGGAIALAVSLA